MRKKSVGVNRKGSEFFKWRSAKEDFTFAAVIFRLKTLVMLVT